MCVAPHNLIKGTFAQFKLSNLALEPLSAPLGGIESRVKPVVGPLSSTPELKNRDTPLAGEMYQRHCTGPGAI